LLALQEKILGNCWNLKEIERAEYRLSPNYLQAGLLSESLIHAKKFVFILIPKNNNAAT